MKRIGMGMFVVVALLAAAGCGSKDPAVAAPKTTTPPAAGSPTASGSASASPSVAPSNLIEFTVDGAGPYQLGATLSALQTGPGLEEITAGGACPDNTTARGTGTWKEVQLSFHKDGKLYLLVNKSAGIPTPSGAWLGTSLDDLKKIYAGVSGEELTRAPASAYLVTTLTGRGVLFDLDANKKVTAMTAGDAGYLRSTYPSGTYC